MQEFEFSRGAAGRSLESCQTEPPSGREPASPVSFQLIGALSVFVPELESPITRLRLQRVLQESSFSDVDERLALEFSAATVLSLKDTVGQILTTNLPMVRSVIDRYPPAVRARTVKWAGDGKDPLIKLQEAEVVLRARLSPPWSRRTNEARRPIGPGSRKLEYRVRKPQRGPTRTILK